MPLVIHVQKKTIYSWVPRQPINPTHYFTKKLHPYDSPQICIRSSHCCQLITSHWTSVSDQQKEEMRRQRWGFPPKDFKVQQPPKKIGTGSIMFNSSLFSGDKKNEFRWLRCLARPEITGFQPIAGTFCWTTSPRMVRRKVLFQIVWEPEIRKLPFFVGTIQKEWVSLYR